jgi:hypothetical protein
LSGVLLQVWWSSDTHGMRQHAVFRKLWNNHISLFLMVLSSKLRLKLKFGWYQISRFLFAITFDNQKKLP